MPQFTKTIVHTFEWVLFIKSFVGQVLEHKILLTLFMSQNDSMESILII